MFTYDHKNVSSGWEVTDYRVTPSFLRVWSSPTQVTEMKSIW